MKKLVSFVLALAMSGCVSQTPAELSSQYAPPRERVVRTTSYHKTAKTVAPACRASFTVRDGRADPSSMGVFDGRAMHAMDAAAWVRSGFETLASDKRIVIVPDGQGDLAVGVEILKAYVSSSVTDITATIVVRAAYAYGGQPLGEQVLRGANNNVNWASSTGDAQGALDRALANLLHTAQTEITARCAEAVKARGLAQ